MVCDTDAEQKTPILNLLAWLTAISASVYGVMLFRGLSKVASSRDLDSLYRDPESHFVTESPADGMWAKIMGTLVREAFQSPLALIALVVLIGCSSIILIHQSRTASAELTNQTGVVCAFWIILAAILFTLFFAVVGHVQDLKRDPQIFTTWAEERYGVEINPPSDQAIPDIDSLVQLDDGTQVRLTKITDSSGESGYILVEADGESEIPRS